MISRNLTTVGLAGNAITTVFDQTLALTVTGSRFINAGAPGAPVFCGKTAYSTPPSTRIRGTRGVGPMQASGGPCQFIIPAV